MPHRSRRARAAATAPGACWATWTLREDDDLPHARLHRRAPRAGTAATHQLSVGVDHVPGRALAPVRPRRAWACPRRTLHRAGPGAPAAQPARRSRAHRLLAARGCSWRRPMTRRASPTWSTAWTRAWASPATRCAAQLLARHATSATTCATRREDLLWVARPSLGAPADAGDAAGSWACARGSTLYSEDPLTAGQFTDAERTELDAPLRERGSRPAGPGWRLRTPQQTGTWAGVARRWRTSTPSPASPPPRRRFDLKPSVT